MIDRKKYKFGDYVESVGFRTESVKNRERPSFKKIDKKEELKMPSKTEMAKNLAKSIGRTASAALKGLDVVSGAELVEKRTSVCRTCPWFVAKGQRCAKCGCVVPLKAYFVEEACPIGKW